MESSEQKLKKSEVLSVLTFFPDRHRRPGRPDQHPRPPDPVQPSPPLRVQLPPHHPPGHGDPLHRQHRGGDLQAAPGRAEVLPEQRPLRLRAVPGQERHPLLLHLHGHRHGEGEVRGGK